MLRHVFEGFSDCGVAPNFTRHGGGALLITFVSTATRGGNECLLCRHHPKRKSWPRVCFTFGAVATDWNSFPFLMLRRRMFTPSKWRRSRREFDFPRNVANVRLRRRYSYNTPANGVMQARSWSIRLPGVLEESRVIFPGGIPVIFSGDATDHWSRTFVDPRELPTTPLAVKVLSPEN